LPKGLHIKKVLDESLSERLASGEINSSIRELPPKYCFEKYPDKDP
tara:strand:- start:1923 stop:2060 length:138 start_codon:yes stop_codon:yes gene_type:complete